MKEMRRIIALVLTLVMVIGMVPVSAFAAEGALVDAAVFCSDIHDGPSTATSIMSAVKASGLTYSTATMVGDTFSDSESEKSTVTSAIRSGLSDTNVECLYAWGDHDYKSDIDNFTGLLYGAGADSVVGTADDANYYIYTISMSAMTDMEGSKTGLDSTYSADLLTAFSDTVEAMDHTKPLFIATHMPLHDRRGDNDYAYNWHGVINSAAAEMDVVVFWAHNHTGDTGDGYDVDTYFLTPGSDLIVEGTSETQEINYTYANAGYINPPNGSGRKNVATSVAIYEDCLSFTVYSASGVYGGTYGGKIENKEVTRKFAASTPTLSAIAISGTTSYFVGDELDLKVTANYSSGDPVDVTESVTWTNLPDMTAAGTFEVTATYEGKTATTSITVAAVQLNSIAVTTKPTKLTYLTGESLDTTGMVVTGTYNNGTTAELTDWYTSYVDMTTAGEKTVTVNYSLDGLAFKTTFTITVEESVSEDITLESIAITSDLTKKEYLVSEELSLDGLVVTATFSDGSTVDLDYKPFSSSAVYGGYELDNFSMYVEKTHEVKVTYTYGEVTRTASTTISVWNEDFEDETTGVKVHVTGDYGVTSAVVTESTNEHVSTAIAGVIQGENYKAYDISLTYSEGYQETDDVKTVTLPIPEGVENPVVYYVSNDGETVTNMGAVKDGNGNVTFNTTHFSTYVIGESTEIEVPENETAPGSDTTTTTETKTVYVLTSSISSGNDYLIVNGNSAGSYYALANNSGSVAATGVTVKTDSEIGTYIELEDATDELWTVSNSYRFQNDGYYLRYNNGLGLSSSNYTTWSYSSNRLSYRNSGGGGGSNSTRYLRYDGDDGWTTTTTSSSATSIYFYIPTEVEVETTTIVSGTYTIEGEDLTVAVSEGSTANLTSTLTFTPAEDNTASVESPVDVSTTAEYDIVTVDANGNAVNGDPNGIIKSISGNTVTFSGNYGKALVKVSYTTSFGDVTDYITVEAKAPYYTIDITDGTKGETDDDGNTTYPSVTSTIALKGITAGQTYQLYYDLVGHGITVPDGATVTWSSSNTSVATVGENGLVTLTGTGGSTTITVTYQIDEDTAVTDTINLTAATSNWYTSADGGENFPAYPNEGAVRFDKTATAVGNFSETGITQVELSMTGVPYTTDNAMDVVVMLDMTGSMSDDGMEAAEEATKAFVEKIVKNEDGTYNNNRVAVYAFNSGSSSPYELVSLKSITSDSELATANTAIDTASDKQESGGTPFDEAAQKCHDVLEAARADGIGNDRQQFCVFMSDGGPTAYEGSDGYSYYGGNNSSGDRAITSYIGGYTSASSSSWTYNLPTEYWTDHMKEDGVTVYTVGLLLQNAPSSPAPYSSMTDSTYDSTTDSLTTIGSHYYFTSTILKNMASDAGKYIDIFDVDNADNATAKFTAIAQSILEAATDVVVQDKIADAYTMVFDIPTGSKEIEGLDSQEFYIEVKEYALDANHERTTSTSLMKLYLGESNGSYYAASDNSGTAYASPVFGTDPIGTKFYWTTTNISGEDDYSGVSVTVSGTTYYFDPVGKSNTASDWESVSGNWFNMTSGAYASGTVNSTNTSTDLIIATPYFVYNASTRMLAWTAAKLSSTELALSYFLYLDRSATEIGTANEIDAATYPTNDYAYLTYTNYLGNNCYQEFPEPQMTWNGAQVTYVFYLVNAAGQPVNQYGQVVDFANAVFVTAPVTESVVWNDEGSEGTASLDVTWAANEILPEGYTIYDSAANYEIHVYETETGALAGINRFIISGSETNGATSSTTKVYNTKAGTKYSAYGTYTSGTVTGTTTTVLSDFDFANTTVAFAVLWETKLVSDTVVVDFGLPVGIEVLANDIVSATLNSVSEDPYSSNYAMNTGVASTGFATPTNGYITLENGDTVAPYGDTIYYSQKDMQFNEPAIFYYDAEVTYYKDSNKLTGYIYSQVTVIPATTVYFEDSFVTLASYTSTGTTDADGNTIYNKDDTSAWTTDGTTATNVTQAADRPGIGNLNDANNAYGYDEAYSTYSLYSLGSAAKVNVNAGKYATATFTFCGTGFDVISMTDKTTGTIVVNVYSGTDTTADPVVSETVDTYYGYKRVTNSDGTYSWETTTANDPNALYQVPVIKIGDGVTTEALDYGTYTVTITATYVPFLDHTAADGYDFYLDAIRIYNPAGNNTDANNAYAADGELLPSYQELRDIIISAKTFDSLTNDSVAGIVFIDSNASLTTVTDYINYGPNNELYLANGQAVSFLLDASKGVASGYAVDSVQIAMKAVDADGAVAKLYNVASDGTASNTITKTLSTSTDMYYDITKLDNGTVVITNTGDGILSITNVKITAKAAAGAASVEDDELNPNDGIDLASADEIDTVATANAFSVSRASTNAALLSMAPVAEEEEPEATEPTEPEATEPSEPEETDPSEPETEPSEPETEPTEPEEEQKPTKPGKPNKPGNNNKPGNGNKNPVWDRFKDAVEFIFGWLLK